MSYTLVIETKDGQSVLRDVSGAIPEGTHRVSGHEDATRIDLSVTRQRPDGGAVASAMHSHTREAPHA